MSTASGAGAFYQSRDVVAAYENGRVGRVFVKDFRNALPVARTNGMIQHFPLYALFDWLYIHRIRELGLDMLGAEVLDVACGTSYVYRELLADGWTGRVSGIDLSPAMIAEGSRKLAQMRLYTPAKVSEDGGLYRYKDALGRSVIDVAPPKNLIHDGSLDFLLAHRQVGDVTSLPSKTYSAVTSFSGPFCYYPAEAQERIVREVCARAERAVSLQFKNAAFAAMEVSADYLERVAGVITHILDRRIRDSYLFLCSTRPDPDAPGQRQDLAPVRHEVGNFSYYPTPLSLLQNWLEDAGFVIVKAGSMGFLSQTFYGLVRKYYNELHADPETLEVFFSALIGIDDYFCREKLLGDNLQVTAVRVADFLPKVVSYKPSGTFRTGYAVHSRDAEQRG